MSELNPLKRTPVTSQILFPANPDYVRPPIPCEADELVEFGDAILVLYWPVKISRMNANIYCYDKVGNLRWIVTPICADAVDSDPYVAIVWEKEYNVPAAQSFSGIRVILDMETGKFTSVGYYP